MASLSGLFSTYSDSGLVAGAVFSTSTSSLTLHMAVRWIVAVAVLPILASGEGTCTEEATCKLKVTAGELPVHSFSARGFFSLTHRLTSLPSCLARTDAAPKARVVALGA